MALHEYQKQMYKKYAVVAALIILPIAGFFAGTIYQKQTGTASTTAMQGQSGTGGRFGGMFRNRAVGTVKSISATSITITSRLDGTDHTYTITSSTTYMNGTSAAQASDIQVGATVLMTLDSSDNTKATQITINPTTMFRGGAGGSTQGTTDSGGNTVLQ